MKKRRKHIYYPPKEPCIYFLEIFSEDKWQIFYIGETEKLIQRLYSHVKEKKDWGLKGKHRYFYIVAPKDTKVRRYYEAYLVVKFQPLHQQGPKMKQYITIVMSRKTKEEKKAGKKRALSIPGYGKNPIHPNNMCDFNLPVTDYKKTEEMQEKINQLNREKFSNTALAKSQNYIKNVQITETKSKFLFHGAKLWAMNLEKLSLHDFKRAKFLLSIIEDRARIYKTTTEDYAKQRQNLPTHTNYIKLNFEEIVIFKSFFSQHGDCLYEPLYCFEHASFVFEKTKDLVIKSELRKQQNGKKNLSIQAIQVQERLKEIRAEKIRHSSAWSKAQKHIEDKKFDWTEEIMSNKYCSTDLVCQTLIQKYPDCAAALKDCTTPDGPSPEMFLKHPTVMGYLVGTKAMEDIYVNGNLINRHHSTGDLDKMIEEGEKTKLK